MGIDHSIQTSSMKLVLIQLLIVSIVPIFTAAMILLGGLYNIQQNYKVTESFNF